MIYKLSLSEDVYSKEHIDELVTCIRSSISRYVDLLGPLNKDNSFDIIWDSDLNQKVVVKITDEHDKYGLVPLEFNLYIDGEEFGPMCYTSTEIATMETKDFILSKLHKKFMEPQDLKLKESVSSSLDRFLKSKVITVDNVTGLNPDCMKKSLMPRGCYFMSGALLGGRVVDHGTIHWQGTDYVFRVKPDGTVVVMTETQAGSNWSETIFKEAFERDDDQEEDLNEFAYRIDDLKQFYNTATSIDKNKYPNFFAWYDAMTKEGKLKNSQITA